MGKGKILGIGFSFAGLWARSSILKDRVLDAIKDSHCAQVFREGRILDQDVML